MSKNQETNSQSSSTTGTQQKPSNGSAEEILKQDSNSIENFINEPFKEDKTKQLFTRHPVHNTPYDIWEIHENGQTNYVLMIGKYRLTNNLTSMAEAKAESEDNGPIRMMQLAQIVYDNKDEARKLDDTIAEQKAIKLHDEYREQYLKNKTLNDHPKITNEPKEGSYDEFLKSMSKTK